MTNDKMEKTYIMFRNEYIPTLLGQKSEVNRSGGFLYAEFRECSGSPALLAGNTIGVALLLHCEDGHGDEGGALIIHDCH